MPWAYAAGDPGRLLDGIAASGFVDDFVGPRVAVALVNLHDSAAVTVNFNDDLSAALMQVLPVGDGSLFSKREKGL